MYYQILTLDKKECITDGEDRDDVIYGAEDYLRDKCVNDGEYGEGEKEVILTARDDSDNETHEYVILTWFADKGE